MSIFGNSNQGFGGGTIGGGGGGGTVNTDGITIVGDGSVGDPLEATSAQLTYNVDLSSGNFPLSGAGVYIVTPDASNTFTFNNTGISDSQKVVIVNTQNLIANVLIANNGSCSVLFQGSFLPVTEVPSGMIYEFIYNTSIGAWLCLSPTPTANVDGGGLFLSAYPIPNQGFYYFGGLDPISGINTIEFPNPVFFSGTRIVVWNRDGSTAITIGGSYIPQEPDNTTEVTSLGALTISEFIAIRNKWIMISQRP